MLIFKFIIIRSILLAEMIKLKGAYVAVELMFRKDDLKIIFPPSASKTFR